MGWLDAQAIDLSSLSEARASVLRQQLAEMPAQMDAAERWKRISNELLGPSDPFIIHKSLFSENYKDWSADRGPAPAVLPTEATVSQSNVGRWICELGLGTYEELHAFSLNQMELFLEMVLEKLGIVVETPPGMICDLSAGSEEPGWLRGARLNIADTALRGDPDRVALIFQKEDQRLEHWSLESLARLSGQVANGLVRLDLDQGDAVAIDMPMTPHAVAIYLGIVRAGCGVVSIADSFAATEISTRLRISNAKAIFTQDFIARGDKSIPLYSRVIQASAPIAIVVQNEDRKQVELRSGDLTFEYFLSEQDGFESVPCDPRDTINVLFSSGTTGDPKAIPWDHTTPIRCALDGYVHQDIQRGDVVAWPTNIGWMMGPWLIFAALINEGVIALYEGMPQTRGFGEFVRDARVNALGVVPSLVKAWRNSNCMAGLDWSSIRLFSSTGESSNSEDMLYLMSLAGYKPVIEYCGGTEVGGGYLSSTVIQPNCPSCFSAKSLGMDSVILDDSDRESEAGELYLIPPALGLSVRLLNGDHHDVYFRDCPTVGNGKKLRRHGDAIEALPGGYFRALGRTDDTMNLGGIKISSVELERAMNLVEGVVETAAIGVSGPDGGPSRLVVYVVSAGRAWEDDPNQLLSELQRKIREHVNPLFKVAEVVMTDRFPRTASNKVMRRLLRSEYQKR